MLIRTKSEAILLDPSAWQRMMGTQSRESGHRTDVLKPLIWIGATVTSLTVAAIVTKAPTWVIISAGVLVALITVAYLVAYFYCLILDKDALRSESFVIQKTAIEQGLYGNNITGLIVPKDRDEAAHLTIQETKL